LDMANTHDAASSQTKTVGAELLTDILKDQPKDSYQPNGLPPIDESQHTPEIIAQLQKRAMQTE
jgi:hypothetical protein